MFTEATETASKFMRPIHTITRTHGSPEVALGAATLFFLNNEGWALTCKRVVKVIAAEDRVSKTYQQFKSALMMIKGAVDCETQKLAL
jgi:hypothetical protein